MPGIHWLARSQSHSNCWWVLIEIELLNWICGHVDNLKWCHLAPGGPIVSRLNPPSSCPPCPAASWLKFYQLWCAVYSVRSAWRNWIENERELIRNAEIGKEKDERAGNSTVPLSIKFCDEWDVSTVVFRLSNSVILGFFTVICSQNVRINNNTAGSLHDNIKEVACDEYNTWCIMFDNLKKIILNFISAITISV